MEAVAEQKRFEINAPGLNGREFEETRVKADAYLRAWKLPNAVVEELTVAALDCALSQLQCDPTLQLTRTTIEAADKLLRERLNEMFGGDLDGAEVGISAQARLAMLCAGVSEKWCAGPLDQAALQKAYVDGVSAAISTRRPQRAPETHPMVMETSLTRLPSLRIVAGWFLLVALLVLAFILTR